MSFNVLVEKSSVFGEQGASSRLNQQILEALAEAREDLVVTKRDLSASPLPFYDSALISALSTPETERTPEQAHSVALADAVIDEVMGADLLIVAAPMYNFNVPAQLKTWMDYVTRAGKTFEYTPQGPKGLLADRPVWITSSRGGLHKGKESDSMTQYLTTYFGFIGFKDLHWVYAEGLNMAEVKDQNWDAAVAQIAEEVRQYA